ncbi:cyclic nucleotide-binding domain-containing protein [Methylobacterium sp. J-030]|uniref:cyclic nucleotide-binding domain-containing protein n=1 Tax=Methylobacterium sp. J-030 TaxID=2836627 RepID=UPI001FB9229F|nr:cyclic nucleotide-binding domain-containing protein [Methylobacterium sp. J-030]MCJ2067343.1 cyclic nucleotide-binding domain-containing protein [Methylobacterium sp. J-030]
MPFLTSEQISAFAAGTIKRTLNIDDVLFAEGNQDGSLFIVNSGVLEVSRTADAEASIVGRIGPGDYIGEIGLLTGAPHGATVRAISMSVVYELKANFAAPILAAQPDLVHELETSARQGQLVLDRAIEASAGVDSVASADLLSRIRSYFQAHTNAKSFRGSVASEQISTLIHENTCIYAVIRLTHSHIIGTNLV